MAEPHVSLHDLTDMQLEAMIRELEADIRHLREIVHDVGPSIEREHEIDHRRHRLESAIRELGHRHK